MLQILTVVVTIAVFRGKFGSLNISENRHILVPMAWE